MTEAQRVAEARERLPSQLERLKRETDWLIAGAPEKSIASIHDAARTVIADARLLLSELDRVTGERDEALADRNAHAEHVLRIAREAEDGFAALEVIEQCWEACGYPSNKALVTLPEQISAMANQIERALAAEAVLAAPAFPSPERIEMRLRILDEERVELTEAIEASDLVEVADALTDMAYLVYGTALKFGIDLDPCFREVHRSNMSKLGTDGRPILRSDGKVLKGPAYSPPDLAPLLKLERGGR